MQQKPDEMSLSLSTSNNPSKRHRFRQDSPVAWYKAYRCIDIDDYMRNPDSEEAEIITDYQFEREKLLRSSGENREKNSRRTKRSKWESANSLENSVLNPETPLTVDESSSKTSFEESDSSSSISAECESSSTDSKDSAGVFIKKKTNRKEHLKTDNDREICSSYLKTSLVDVDLAAKGSYQNVPFVCLTSKFNGKAIMGYPLEVEVINQSVEVKRFDQLVWKTGRRTPICYVTNSLSCSGLVKQQSNVLKQGLGRNCVPVEAIFSKILAAVCEVVQS